MSYYIRRIIRVLVHPTYQLAINPVLWGKLLHELHQRGPGSGRLESGAFLLGTRRGGRRNVLKAIYYDDLDPHCLNSGAIEFCSSGYATLWSQCRQSGLDVVADVHTHPGPASQSGTDACHPMIPEVGHLAMIIPHLARQGVTPAEVGIYVHLGQLRWEPQAHALYVGIWAD